MPKVPKNAPKYLPAFFEHVQQRTKKKVVGDACMQMSGIFDKYWTEFQELNEAELASKPKKAKKENFDKKAETAVKNLGKVFGEISPETQPEILAQMRDIVASSAQNVDMNDLFASASGGGSAAAGGSASSGGGGLAQGTKQHLRESIDNMSTHLDDMQQTLDKVREASPSDESQPLIETTATVISVFQAGMQDICDTLQLDAEAHSSSGKGTNKKKRKRKGEAAAAADEDDQEEEGDAAEDEVEGDDDPSEE